MSERRCPACAAAASHARGEKNGLRINSCAGCRTLYAYQQNGAGEDYDNYYHAANLSVPAFIDRRLDEIIAGFAPFLRRRRLLDIGSGAGSILHAAKRAGWDAEGLEVSRPAVEHTRRAGFKVFCGELAEAKYPTDYFDVVTASEVLEHVADPQAMLDEIARLLRPGGLFWGTTPHGRGVSARLLGLKWSAVSPPEHLQLFSLGGLRGMLKRAGFRRLHVTSRAVNPFELWHELRRGGVTTHEAEGQSNLAAGSFDRVGTSHQLNEALTKNSGTKLVKATINRLLGVARLGDSIRIWAEK